MSTCEAVQELAPVVLLFQEPPWRYQRERNLPPDVQMDGDMYLPPQFVPKVGTLVSPDAILKTIRIPHTEMMPERNNAGRGHHDLTRLAMDDTDSGFFRSHIHAPVGAVLTLVEVRMFRASGSAAASYTLYEVDDAPSATPIATGIHATTGWVTLADTLNNVVEADKSYVIDIFLQGDTPGVVRAAVTWARYTYAVPDYATTI